ncbi:hypothetical protein TNCV_143701 [Trichonephila clavipes]|nr:hypothetical protein TNCV_143701 [Trichonephila clavipes]
MHSLGLTSGRASKLLQFGDGDSLDSHWMKSPSPREVSLLRASYPSRPPGWHSASYHIYFKIARFQRLE